MDLISALASGISGAESGHAELYVRGTSTRANWFSDFEGTSQISTGLNIPLDVNGGATVFVNQYVDVTVRSAAGVLVRQFTQGHTATTSEYIGAAFKGVSYDGGASAINQPITTKDALDKWTASAGEPDFQVTIGGSATDLTAAFGPITQMWFNVKDPTFGATGDGVADDTSEIQAAIDAANTAGGGVVLFPEGTYLTTSALDWKATVSLKGSGAGVTKILLDHASNDCITVAANTQGYMEDLTIVANQANSGTLMKFSGTSFIVVNRCKIGDSNSTAVDGCVDVSGVAAETTFVDCIFPALGSAATHINAPTNTGKTILRGCDFTTPATCNSTNGLLHGKLIQAIGCSFDTSSSTSGTFSVFKTDTTTVTGEVKDCVFSDSGGATVKGIDIGQLIVEASTFWEAGNEMPADDTNGFSAYNPYTFDLTDSAVVLRLKLETRERRAELIENNSASVSVDPKQFGISVISRTGTAAFIIDDGNRTSPPLGGTYTLVVRADGGTTGTVTYSILDAKPSPADGTITNLKFDMFFMVSGLDDGVSARPRLYIMSERRDA